MPLPDDVHKLHVLNNLSVVNNYELHVHADYPLIEFKLYWLYTGGQVSFSVAESGPVCVSDMDIGTLGTVYELCSGKRAGIKTCGPAV